MRLPSAPLVAVFALLVGGCASGPSPEVMELQRQNAELKQANEAISRRELAEQKQQEQQKKVEQARTITAKVQAEQEAEHQARFAKDKVQVIAELNKRYAPHCQEVLEAFGFRGTILRYEIDDASIDGDVIYFRHQLEWKKPDASFGYAAVVNGYDRKKDEIVYTAITDSRNFTPAEFAAIIGNDPKAIAATPAPAPRASATPSTTAPSPAGQESTFYQRNQQNIEQAAIGVGAAAATYGLEKWIESFFESNQ